MQGSNVTSAKRCYAAAVCVHQCPTALFRCENLGEAATEWEKERPVGGVGRPFRVA
jgi:hypothetical protein